MSASPISVRVADEIVTALNDGDWPAAVTASRTYTPGEDLRDLDGIIAEVVPLGQSEALGGDMGTKTAVTVTASVGIGFQSRVDDSESVAEVDAVLSLAEAIVSSMLGQQYADMVVTGISREEMLDWDALENAASITQAIQLELTGQEVMS